MQEIPSLHLYSVPVISIKERVNSHKNNSNPDVILQPSSKGMAERELKERDRENPACDGRLTEAGRLMKPAAPLHSAWQGAVHAHHIWTNIRPCPLQFNLHPVSPV